MRDSPNMVAQSLTVLCLSKVPYTVHISHQYTYMYLYYSCNLCGITFNAMVGKVEKELGYNLKTLYFL